MGFELNRIMKQYGVSTPSMATYSGTAAPSMPTAPTGSRPADDIGEAEIKERQQAYDQQLSDFNAYTEDPYTYKANKGFVGYNTNNFKAPIRPLGDRPAGTGAGVQAAYDKQLADFNAYTADPNALNEQMRKYNIDKESYDKYKNTYQSRLQNTPMYAQGQFQKDQPQMTFQTGQPLVGNTLTPDIAKSLMQASMMDGSGVPTSEFNKYGGYDKVKALYDAGGGSYAKPTQSSAYTVADLYRMYLGREPEAGIFGAASASTRPNFINEAQAELNTKPTFGNQNLMNATGSYYGNQLKNPIYAAYGGSVHDLAEKYADGGPVGYGFGGAISRALNSGRDANNNSDYANFMIQQQQAGAPTQFAEPPPDYDKIVKDAYGTLQGRTGIGAETGNIDQGGLDYWKGQLASGAIKQQDFNSVFGNATNQYMAANPEDKYTKYVQGFKNIQKFNPADYGPPKPSADVLGARQAYEDLLKRPLESIDPSQLNALRIASGYGPNSNITPVANSPEYISAPSGRSGDSTKTQLTKAGLNAVLSYAIGPQYDFAKGVSNLAGGNIGEAAGNFVSGFTGGLSKVFKWSDGGSVHDLAEKYAQGGPVKTHYQTAGPVRYKHDYVNPEEEQDIVLRTPPSEAVASPVEMRNIPQQVTNEMPVVAAAPKSVLTQVAANNLKADPMPAAPAAAVAPVTPAALPFGGERLAGIQALLATYGPKDSAYSADLKTARDSAKAETDAFAKMLTGAMNSPEDAQSSKAEMYFRLASAFGAPTKTGQFSENLSMVGKELGEYAKGKRATSQQKLALALEGQKMKMTSSKEDLNTLRALSAEEMKDKRAIATELIKDYIKSGEPQSTAGKQALDEGLKAGTPDYQKRVAEIGNANVEAKMAQITAALANVQTSAANMATQSAQLALAQNKFENQKTQQAKLSPAEVKLKVEAEDTLAQTDQALTNLKKAYALNPNTFDGSLLDVAQRKLYEQSGSKDPKVISTRELENLLKKASLSQLKATFPGAISNDERAALDAVQGLDAKSKDERAVIMKNAFTALKSVSERHRRRLNEINQGVYRDTAPIEGGTN